MSQSNSYAAQPHAERMRGFLADVEQLARSAHNGQWPRLGQVEGSDGTGSVSFAVDDGGAFAAVHLDPRWWRELGVAGLPGALLEAQQNAHVKLTAARLVFRRTIGPPPRAKAPSFDWRHRLATTTDASQLITSWRATTTESYQRMYEYDRRREVIAGREPTVVGGPDGLVRLTLAGGRITDVEVTEGRVSEASTDLLVADIRAALREDGRMPRG